MVQKQLNGEEKKLFFSASSVKLNSQFNFLAFFWMESLFTDKRE